MKKIKVEVDVPLTAEDITGYLDESDPITRLRIVRSVVVGFPDDDLQSIREFCPEAVVEFVKELRALCDTLIRKGQSITEL